MLLHICKYILFIVVLPHITGGHHSPLGGYDPTTDSYLLWDTWPLTPVKWFPAKCLVESMDSEDSKTCRKRGWIAIECNT